MSEGQHYYEDPNAGGQLRRQFEAVLAENQALKQEREERLMKETQASVSTALEAAGYLAGQASFVPQDVAVDPARLEGWLKDNGGLLARGAESEPSTEGGATNIDAGKADTIRKAQALSAGGANATLDIDALHARMKDRNMSEADFDNLMSQYRN